MILLGAPRNLTTYFHRSMDAISAACSIAARCTRIAHGLGANVIAFGHTADDFCEALLRNIMFTGKLSSLPPVTFSKNREYRLIGGYWNVSVTVFPDCPFTETTTSTVPAPLRFAGSDPTLIWSRPAYCCCGPANRTGIL